MAIFQGEEWNGYASFPGGQVQASSLKSVYIVTYTQFGLIICRAHRGQLAKTRLVRTTTGARLLALLNEPPEQGQLFIFGVAASKEPEAYGPVKFHNKTGWRYRPGLGLSQLFHISLHQARVKQGGGERSLLWPPPPSPLAPALHSLTPPGPKGEVERMVRANA
ncbi:unnamed protein product [Pleuronectes platessa]|uniref:Uncharacterized protein n=1 Tax=Pleuronectes platessa TaxID=8262 RepID=A0A9N7TZC0_PLEPL|nr:unnamed protein product [Pleuronectes platessa]